jgi:hypothetical protein
MHFAKNIHSVEDWYKFAPPKNKNLQWQDFRSAKELAKNWCQNNCEPSVPDDVKKFFNSHDLLKDFEIIEAIPEEKIAFDEITGPRNCDLVAIGKDKEKILAINFEAKADEEFDKRIKNKKGKSENSKIPERIERLKTAIVPRDYQAEESEINLIRYQLLNGLAATLAYAKLIEGDLAVFIIHEFFSDRLSEPKISRNEKDLNDFIKVVSNKKFTSLALGGLIGPINVPGNDFIPKEIPIYVGKIRTNIQCL